MSEPILDFFVETGYACGYGIQLNISNPFMKSLHLLDGGYDGCDWDGRGVAGDDYVNGVLGIQDRMLVNVSGWDRYLLYYVKDLIISCIIFSVLRIFKTIQIYLNLELLYNGIVISIIVLLNVLLNN